MQQRQQGLTSWAAWRWTLGGLSCQRSVHKFSCIHSLTGFSALCFCFRGSFLKIALSANRQSTIWRTCPTEEVAWRIGQQAAAGQTVNESQVCVRGSKENSHSCLRKRTEDEKLIFEVRLTSRSLLRAGVLSGEGSQRVILCVTYMYSWKGYFECVSVINSVFFSFWDYRPYVISVLPIQWPVLTLQPFSSPYWCQPPHIGFTNISVNASFSVYRTNVCFM